VNNINNILARKCRSADQSVIHSICPAVTLALHSVHIFL